MARLNRRAASTETASPEATGSRLRAPTETPPTPAEYFGSDKENQAGSTLRRGSKRKSDNIAMSEMAGPSGQSSRKRARVADHRPTEYNNSKSRRGLKEAIDTTFYDPDQDEEKKRATKKNLRNLASELNDSRAEYLQATSSGLRDTVNKANDLYRDVKQTDTAAIDARLMVTVGDLAYRKANFMTLGDASTGVDVDDFITKCISFMQQGEMQDDALTATQRRRNRQLAEDDEDEAADLNWGHLGRNACFLYNSRPCVSGFLLGPLSVQKKVRQQTQRKATQARTDPSQAVRPIELAAEDLDKQESAVLTVVCSEIARLLQRTQQKGEAKAQEEVDAMLGEPSETELQRILRKYNISDNGGVPLFNFCINPKSFGQTVENFFYVSFLIKEGRVGLEFDQSGLPTLSVADTRSVTERQETQRNQAVFTLDFNVWEDLIESCAIEKSIIPHRIEEEWDDGTLPQQVRTPTRQESGADDL